MNQCVCKVLELFQGDTKCAAIALAVAAFVAGLVAMCIMCKLLARISRKPCSSACSKKAKKGENRPFEKRKPHPAPADGSVEIYVGNLSYDMTEEQLANEFKKFGKVNSVRLVINRYTGKSKGFGFIQMPVRAEAEKACAALNDSEILGRKIKCNEAKNLI